MPSQAQSNTLPLKVNPEAFIAFCDGMEQAGLVEYARRGRVIARALIEAQAGVGRAQASLISMTVDRDRWRDDRWREVHGQAWPK